MAEASQVRKRATATDVAREAGVSRVTVYYILNDKPGQKFPEATRKRVRDAATKLGYSPSPAARALRSGRSDQVLFLFPDWPIGYAAGVMLSNLSAALERRGLSLLVHARGPAHHPVTTLWGNIAPAAVLLMEELTEAEAAAMKAAGVNVVIALFGRSPRFSRTPEPTELIIGQCQAGHLIARGHTRLGYAMPDDQRLQVLAEPRLEGVRRVCREAGLAAPEVQITPLTVAGSARGVESWRKDTDPVTGVAAYNDEIAFAVLAGIHHLGLRSPADLAVIGADGSPMAALSRPPLTTMTRDHAALAEHLAQTVVNKLDGKPAPRRVRNDDQLQLIQRATT